MSSRTIIDYHAPFDRDLSLFFIYLFTSTVISTSSLVGGYTEARK